MTGRDGSSPAQVPDRAWFARPVLDVARDLLGATLTRRSPDGPVSVRLTEVEAYAGESDPGSHAARGQTGRNTTMFGEPGHLYAYRHLGLHTCMNLVCRPAGEASGVLLRAAEVVEGVDLARRRRTAAGVARTDRDLARGPARLTVALDVTTALDGVDVLDPDGPFVLSVGAAVPSARVRTGPRVGVSGAGGDGTLFPWRLWLADEPTVSAYRPVYPRRRATGQTSAHQPPIEE